MRFKYSQDIHNDLMQLMGLINIRIRNLTQDKDLDEIYYISDTFHNTQKLIINSEEELKPYLENIEKEVGYMRNLIKNHISNNNYFLEKYIQILDKMKTEISDFIKLKNIEDF